jgi:hypothetical protein
MDLFQYQLRVMLRSDLAIGDGFRAKLDAKVATRDPASEAARLREIQSMVDRMVLPDRYRRGHVPL